MPTRVKITARGNGKRAKKYPLAFGNDRPLHIPIAKNNCNGDHFSRQVLTFIILSNFQRQNLILYIYAYMNKMDFLK